MNEPRTADGKRSKTYYLSRTALMTAVICVLAPLALPIGPVPISLATLAIYLSIFIVGWKMSAISCLVYIIIGAVGLPVFSGFSGGLAKLAGPTGGYILGYIPMVIASGLIMRNSSSRLLQFLALTAGTIVLYALGTAWFCFQAGASLGKAMGLCVIPFIPGDLIKIFAAMLLGPAVRKRLVKAGMLR